MNRTKKKPVVTRNFLIKLANTIYDPKTRHFLHLCRGKLLNGPDPTDRKRSMHCGLGELYVAMTGRQPDGGLKENIVIDLAVKLSPLNGVGAILRKKTVSAIKALKLPNEITVDLTDTIRNQDSESFSNESRFREILNDIPAINDDDDWDEQCDIKTFQERSRRVAKKFREAAKLLP